MDVASARPSARVVLFSANIHLVEWRATAALRHAVDRAIRLTMDHPSFWPADSAGALPVGSLPLLSIAIPTFNRASFLDLALTQLRRELAGVPAGRVELLVCDNCSHDETELVVRRSIAAGLGVRYLRNSTNIGSDANFAQCFDVARGKYVLLMGDDDVLVDGALRWIVEYLERNEYGVVCLRPYGYEFDFRAEYPRCESSPTEFSDPGAFLARIGPLMTLISACVVNKSLLPRLVARDLCGGNLVQVHFVIQAALLAPRSAITNRYLVACRRNNSGGYSFSRVFVEEFGSILDGYVGRGLNRSSIAAIEARLLMAYYPFYLFRERIASAADLVTTRKRFADRFDHRPAYLISCYPILVWPRPLAILWGALAIFFGRGLLGDARRGLTFARSRLRRHFQKPVLAQRDTTIDSLATLPLAAVRCTAHDRGEAYENKSALSGSRRATPAP